METWKSRLQGVIILVMIGLFIFFAARVVSTASRAENLITYEKSQLAPKPEQSAQAPSGTAAPSAEVTR
jgi:recombinational DNA repair protein (RecF pathway)